MASVFGFTKNLPLPKAVLIYVRTLKRLLLVFIVNLKMIKTAYSYILMTYLTIIIK